MPRGRPTLKETALWATIDAVILPEGITERVVAKAAWALQRPDAAGICAYRRLVSLALVSKGAMTASRPVEDDGGRVCVEVLPRRRYQTRDPGAIGQPGFS